MQQLSPSGWGVGNTPYPSKLPFPKNPKATWRVRGGEEGKGKVAFGFLVSNTPAQRDGEEGWGNLEEEGEGVGMGLQFKILI